jgi:hypothetical protein
MSPVIPGRSRQRAKPGIQKLRPKLHLDSGSGLRPSRNDKKMHWEDLTA